MWKLEMFQKKYLGLEFEFPSLEKAVDFISKASTHTAKDIEFHLTRKDGEVK